VTSPSLLVLALVDDDCSVRKSLARLLRLAGYAVSPFASAEEYLAAGLSPDLLLLDVRMPGMDGPALHTHLVARGDHTPVIFISAHDDVPAVVAAMRAGAADFLMKPVTEDTLLFAIDRAIGAHRSGR